MLKESAKNRIKDILVPVFFFLLGFLILEVLGIIFKIPEFFIPKPSQIFIKISQNFTFFLEHLWVTLSEALLGYFISIFLSLVLATVFVYFPTIEKGVYPFAIAIKIAPIVAIAPFVILWFGIGFNSKIAIVVIMCFFAILVNTTKGLKTIDEEALELFKSFSASKWQIFQKLRLPSSLPFIFQGLKISSSLSLSGACVGEFLASEKGIGYLISINIRIYETTTAMAALFLLILTGILFFATISLIEKRVVFWQKSEGF